MSNLYTFQMLVKVISLLMCILTVYNILSLGDTAKSFMISAIASSIICIYIPYVVNDTYGTHTALLVSSVIAYIVWLSTYLMFQKYASYGNRPRFTYKFPRLLPIISTIMFGNCLYLLFSYGFVLGLIIIPIYYITGYLAAELSIYMQQQMERRLGNYNLSRVDAISRINESQGRNPYLLNANGKYPFP